MFGVLAMGIDFVNEYDEWIVEWKRQVNENSDYHEVGAGWGVDFNGDYIFEVQSDEDLEEPLYSFAEVQDGEVLSARQVSEDELDDLDYGFIYKGTYNSWKKLIHGDVGPIDGLMSGEFELDGDMQKVLQYSDGAAELASGANKVDTKFPA